MSEAVRWLDQAMMWHTRGFDEASRYCTQKVRQAAKVATADPKQRPRALVLIAHADRVDQLIINPDAFERTVTSAVWNGHALHKSEHQQEENNLQVIHGEPNIKPGLFDYIKADHNLIDGSKIAASEGEGDSPRSGEVEKVQEVEP